MSDPFESMMDKLHGAHVTSIHQVVKPTPDNAGSSTEPSDVDRDLISKPDTSFELASMLPSQNERLGWIKSGKFIGAIAAGLTLFLGYQVLSGGDGGDNGATTLYDVGDIGEPLDVASIVNDTAPNDTNNIDEPLLGAILLDPQDIVDVTATTIQTPTTLESVPTTLPESTSSTLVDTTTTSTSRSTSTPTTTEPIVETTIATPTTLAAVELANSNPYARLNCDISPIVFEKGWTASEVASNCSIKWTNFVSDNSHITDFDKIITGVTKVYLRSAQSTNTESASGQDKNEEFDCAAQLGAYYTVHAGEIPSGFLSRVIRSHGYTDSQIEWMLGFPLLSRYDLVDEPLLYGTKRCAPRSNAYSVLFPEGVPD